MRVLLTGATGMIGGAVLRRLTPAHEVLALTRRAEAQETLSAAGATPVVGRLDEVGRWAADLPPLDALVHCAADFSAPDMGAAEAPLVEAVEAGRLPLTPGARILYTGGVWLYPAGAETVSDEATPLDPLPAFGWMARHWRRLKSTAGVKAICIHPGLVFDNGEGGVLEPLIDALRGGGTVALCGGPTVRWPMVHADDLADLYARALDRGEPGAAFNGVAADGVPVEAVVQALAAERGMAAPALETMSESEAQRLYGPAADGFARSQRVSGARAGADLGWRPARPVPGASPTADSVGD